jgi:UPF0755 protein
MARQRTAAPTIMGLLLAFLFCLFLAVGAVGVSIIIPRLARDRFGPPSAALDSIQQFIYSIRLLSLEKDLTQPVSAAAGESEFKIALGESAGSVAARLQEDGIIRNAEAFRIYLIYAGLDTRLQAGQYQLSPSVPAIEIANKLQDATPGEVAFPILPGWRIEEIAASLPTSGLSLTMEDFLRAAQQIPENLPFSLPRPDALSLEGLFLPDTYQFKRDISLDQLIASIMQNFNQRVTPALRQDFNRQGLTLYQAVILASIVQREAMVVSEQPEIASVFLNRLRSGMKLDSDPTIQYALGFNSSQNTWWTNPLSGDDLHIDSLYNTYINLGLPPGPICNPGISALEAVASPAETPYFYFRARCDGSGKHVFASTLDQHIQNACK